MNDPFEHEIAPKMSPLDQNAIELGLDCDPADEAAPHKVRERQRKERFEKMMEAALAKKHDYK